MGGIGSAGEREKNFWQLDLVLSVLLPLRRHLEMSGEILFVTRGGGGGGGGGVLASSGERSGMRAAAPQQRYLAPNVNSIKGG